MYPKTHPVTMLDSAVQIRYSAWVGSWKELCNWYWNSIQHRWWIWLPYNVSW